MTRSYPNLTETTTTRMSNLAQG